MKFALKFKLKKNDSIETLEKIWKWYTHACNTTPVKDWKEWIMTSNDHDTIFWNKSKSIRIQTSLYWIKQYLKDKIWWIWESEETINIEDITSWTKEMTNKILEPIHWTWKMTFKELEKLLQESYWAWTIHKYKTPQWKEINIRFATSFNIRDTNFLRTNENVDIWWVTEWKNVNTTWKDTIAIDWFWFSSIPAAPTWWYESWEKLEPNGFWILWKAPEWRPMDKKFDINSYKEIMNTKFKITFKWFAFESSKDEIVIMPVFEIYWKKIETLWKKVSHKLPEDKTIVKTRKKELADL